jgi:hypothetical protein
VEAAGREERLQQECHRRKQERVLSTLGLDRVLHEMGQEKQEDHTWALSPVEAEEATQGQVVVQLLPRLPHGHATPSGSR